MMGIMSMNYVTNPDDVVTGIQSLLDTTKEDINPSPQKDIPIQPTEKIQRVGSKEHAYDTRNKVRDVLQ